MNDDERNEKLAKVVDDFSDAINGFGTEPKAFIDAFCRQHRTLQQSMFGVILQLIGFMASEDYQTDGRNDASKTMAKSIIAGLGDQFEHNEFLYYFGVFTDDDKAKAKAKENRMNFEAHVKNYLHLPCV